MNLRNAEALEAALQDTGWFEGYPDVRLRIIADALASRGVLVPSALTDDEVQEAISDGVTNNVHDDGDGRIDEWTDYHRDEFVAVLERIAKGESAGERLR